jgi:4-hydroxybenzoate polyprenyltransferase
MVGRHRAGTLDVEHEPGGEMSTRTPVAGDTVPPAPPAGGRRKRMFAPIAALRPGEWIKNAFVVAPLVFSGQLEHSSTVLRTIGTTIAFCAVASAGYLVNDLRDIELDRQHPQKRNRAIASGALNPRVAMVMAVVLALGGATLAYLVRPAVLLIVVGYILLTTTYSMVLKRLVIIDVMTIAGGFLLRVEAGLVAIHGVRSEWLILCTSALAMLLGFTKRRQEAVSELHDGQRSRPVLEHYSLPFLDQMVSISATATLLSYVLYTQNSQIIGSRMLPTAIPVTYGVLRYLYLIYHRRDSRSTAMLLVRDKAIVGAGVVWIALAAILLYV